MSENTAEDNVVVLEDISTWQQRMHDLANEHEVDAPQIRVPKRFQGRVNREQIAAAFITSFEMIGGTPRLALWGDANPTEFYRIFGRLLPKETVQVHDGEVKLVHSIAPSKLDQEDGS